MTVREIASLPVASLMADRSHCYLWVPNTLLAEGLMVLENWGFTYKSNLVWHKIRKDGGCDGRGVGFYFRNVTELVLFGIRGGLRTFAPDDVRSTCSPAKKGNIPVNLTSFTRSSSSAPPGRTWNCLLVIIGRTGSPGATKPLSPGASAQPGPKASRPPAKR